jgi:uncharacterized protein (DUF2267 family)
MEEIVNQLAQRVGISPEQAQTVITTVSRTLLQKSEPGKAQGLLSKLPSGISGMFSDNDKQQFTTTRQDVSNNDLVQQIDREAGINDKKKSRQAAEESVRLLQDKTGEGGLLDNVMGGFKDLNPFD